MSGTSLSKVTLNFHASLPVRDGRNEKSRLRGEQSLPLGWVDGDGSGLVQALRDDHVAEGAVQPGHFDHVEALIRPVNVPY